MRAAGTLVAILRIPLYRRLVAGIGLFYLVLFLLALQDISTGGRGWHFLTAEWSRMFERTGTFTFEPVAQIIVPGLSILISPVNVAIGVVLASLAGLNLTVTYIAFTQPSACSFNRSTGVLASLPALLAGGACCAPAVILIFGLQASSLLIGTFQVMIPLSMVFLLLALKLILERTHPEFL